MHGAELPEEVESVTIERVPMGGHIIYCDHRVTAVEKSAIDTLARVAKLYGIEDRPSVADPKEVAVILLALINSSRAQDEEQYRYLPVVALLKAMRALTGCSLRDGKDALDGARP